MRNLCAPRRVAVYGTVTFEGKPLPDGDSTLESLEDGVGIAVADPEKLRVPLKYADPAKSGLEITVDANHRRIAIDVPE